MSDKRIPLVQAEPHERTLILLTSQIRTAGVRLDQFLLLLSGNRHQSLLVS